MFPQSHPALLSKATIQNYVTINIRNAKRASWEYVIKDIVLLTIFWIDYKLNSP
jgi:hypothetical protein